MPESKQDAVELARKIIDEDTSWKRIGYDGGIMDERKLILAQAVLSMQGRIFNLEGDVMQGESAMGMVFEQVKRAGIANPRSDGSYIQTQKMVELAVDKLEAAEAQVTALRTALRKIEKELKQDPEPNHVVAARFIISSALSANPPAATDWQAQVTALRTALETAKQYSYSNAAVLTIINAALSANPPPAAPDTTLFQDGEFIAASGQTLPFKIECDALTDADWEWAARYVASYGHYSKVEGVPQGGLKFAEAFRPHLWSEGGLLILDDVLTTGESMERQRNGRTAKGVVLFARGPCPDWVTPIWTLAAPDTTAIVEAKDV